MTVFADSSALLKRYVPEHGSEVVLSFDGFAVSDLARVEVPAAIWQKQRIRALTASRATALVRHFEVDWHGEAEGRARFVPVELADQVLGRAAALTARHQLRAGDAIQLASALAAREADPSCRRFACYDRRLADAAAREGFDVIPA